MAASGLAQWLDRHGLAALAGAFSRHDIDLDLLPQLSDADLKELGLSLGQRRRLGKALSTLLDEPQGAERRQLTILFVDLVGSTALSARLDPEELREVIRAFQNVAAGEVARYQGHVAMLLGDGVLASFGWPAAHEDDAERAVRAGLAVLRQVGQLLTLQGDRLSAHAGIASGTVVVGSAGREITGETPNLAARLQALAGPGELVIAETTLRLVHGLFAVVDLGRCQLKGFAAPQAAFRVVGERPAETRFAARHDEERLTPIIGRERELAFLLERWDRAARGDGTVVLLGGEAGIGKSRLIGSLQHRLKGRPHLRLRYQCSPFHTDSALWPITEQLTRAAGFRPEDDEQARLLRLRTLLAASAEDVEAALPVVAHLLGMAAPGGAGLVDLPAAERKRRLFDTLTAQLPALARQSPVLLVIEDTHWIDPTTAELFDQVFADLAGLPMLAVATFRPEQEPPWRPRPCMARLVLEPLPPAAAVAIVTQVTPGLSTVLVDSIVEKADGVPLFIEEVARAVAEGAAEGRSQPAVPASLHDTLMARLDRLGNARRVAQIGAAIGRSFSRELLAEVQDLPADRLATALAALLGSGLVTERKAGNGATLEFKHALVQDVAYGSLLKSQRREIHGRIADVLLAEPRTTPEVVAHHLTRAGRTDAAVAAWREAARRAVQRAANLEATRHLDRALELVADLPEGDAGRCAELVLRLELAVPLIALHGFGSDAVAACAGRAHELAEVVGDEAQRFAALRVVWNSGLMRGPLPAAVARAQELMRRARASGGPARLAVAHRALGYSLCMSGRQQEALPLLQQGQALADGLGDAPFALFGEHPGLVCRFYAAWCLALMGEVPASRERADAALAMARRLRNPHGLAWALVCIGVPALFVGDYARAEAFESEALEVAEAYRLPQWVGFARNYLGRALFERGHRERGLALVTEGLAGVHGTGAVLNTTVLLWNRAECRLALGDLAGAKADAEAGLDHARRLGEGIVQPQLLRIVGEIAARKGDDPAQFWQQGLALATAQGAGLWRRHLMDVASGDNGARKERG